MREKELHRLLQALAEQARIAYGTLTIHVAGGHVHHVTGSETGKPGSLGRLFPGASMT